MLTPGQVGTIKQRFIEQIDSTFPEDRKEFAKNQVEAMDADQLEQFLIKNNLIKGEGTTGEDNCVFCSIVSGSIKSHKIAENSKAIAVLEINPLTRGHAIIIPREHVASEGEMPKGAQSLAKKISDLLKSKLQAKTTKTESSSIMGHVIINVVPIYDSAPLTERKTATPEELSEVQEILKKDVKAQKTKRPAEKKEKKAGIKKIMEKIGEFEEKIWLPKRIP